MVASTVCENNGATPYREQTYDCDDASKIEEFKLLDLVTPATLQEIDYAYGATDGILESEDHIGTSNDIEYTYDDFGNILTRKQGPFGSPTTSDVYAYSGHDQLDTITRNGNLWKEFFYDSNGRRTSFKVSSATVQTYTYDDADRITAIAYPYVTGDTFAYNGIDTRLSKSENGSSTNFYRGGPGVTDPVLSDSGAVYTPGISERRSSTTTFSHSGIKNAAYQTGTGGTQTAEKEYDAYGNVLNSGGS